MSGEAEKYQSSKSGTYLLQMTPINGYPCWKKTSGKYAVWFDNKNGNWKVGLVDEIGSTLCFFHGPDNVDEWPTNKASKWKFYGREKWQEAGNDIIFEDCTPFVVAYIRYQYKLQYPNNNK